MTGVITSTWIVDVIMPPRIGAAIGFMTSEPTPLLHMMGTRLAITTVTVISFGRSRRTEPSIVACHTSFPVISPPSRSRLSEGFVQVHDHHHTGLDCHAVQGDVADPHGDREVVAKQPLQDDAAGYCVDHRQHHDGRLRRGVKRHVEQHEDDEEDERNEHFQPLARADLELVLTGPLQRVARGQLQVARDRRLGRVTYPPMSLVAAST